MSYDREEPDAAEAANRDVDIAGFGHESTDGDTDFFVDDVGDGRLRRGHRGERNGRCRDRIPVQT